MARDDQGWNNERSRHSRGERDSDTQDRDMRDRDMRQGFSRPREWGENEGGWDEGASRGRSYGQGMSDQRPGAQGQEGLGAGRDSSGSHPWGPYARESNHGSDLGRARNQYGNTGSDNYGGGGFGGGAGYGSFGNQSWGNSYGTQYGDIGQSGLGSAGIPGGWQQSGNTSGQSHVGRGPKGWKRSDDRIREDVNEQLERHPQIDASDIEVRVEDGEVMLSGHVPDRRTKRLAEDVVENVSGVRDVQNQIRVKREGGVQFGSADGSTTPTGTSPASNKGSR